MHVKNCISLSDKNIKNIERKIQRQKEIIQFLLLEVNKKRSNKTHLNEDIRQEV